MRCDGGGVGCTEERNTLCRAGWAGLDGGRDGITLAVICVERDNGRRSNMLRKAKS